MNDIELLLKTINACQSIEKGCVEAKQSSSSLNTELKLRNKSLKKVFVVEKIATTPYKLVYNIDLEVILDTLNKTKSISLAELELGISQGYLHKLIKSKGYKLLKRWEIVDL